MRHSTVRALIRSSVFPSAVIGSLVAHACSGGDGGPQPQPQPTPANIAIVDGNTQQGIITLPLANALIVRVTDADGDPVTGVTVQWNTAAGTIPATSTTGADGRAQASWTLGPTAGAVSATAGNPSFTGTKSVTFTATALGASAAILSGNNQNGTARTALPNPLIVELRDANNDPVQGKQVNWAIVTGGGSVNPAGSTSGADGRAQTVFTPGCTVGNQTASATAASFTGSPATFQANVSSSGGAAAVDVNDNFFSPAAVTICAGEQVEWTWRGVAPHNVTFDAGGPNSMTLTGAGNTFSRTFASTGTFTYLCTVHGTSMSGSVIVQ